MNVLSPDEMLHRLDDRFGVLRGGHRAASSRQQTLRATLDWSYYLLTPSERVLLRRVSVFQGGSRLVARMRSSGQRLERSRQSSGGS
jgi:predicted ATPase